MIRRELYLIDATAFCYRAFYGLKGLATSTGEPTNAIYGFVNILNKILKEKKPEYLAVCFDVSRDTFRQKKYADYKIQRPPMPDGLSSQIPIIKEIVRAQGLTICEKNGYEADDIIATLSTKARNNGFSVVIVSSDKDILQLVDKDVSLFSPYKDAGAIYDKEKVKERYGVEPKQIVDIISLMGDVADNIPGVPGVGEKTAVELIRTFGSLKELLLNVDRIKQDKLRLSITDHIERIKLNQELVVLDNSIELGVEPEDLKLKTSDHDTLFKIYKRLEFKSFLKELSPFPGAGTQKDIHLVEGDKIKSLLDKADELILHMQEDGGLSFCIQGKFSSVNKINGDIRDALSNSDIKKIGFDLKRTKVALKAKGIEFQGLYFDTMLAAYLINPSKPVYKLEDAAWDFLEEHIKPESLDALRICDLIRRLKPKLELELKERLLSKLFYEIEMPLTEVLAQLELIGIKIDREKLKKLSVEVGKRLVKLVSLIYELAGSEFNINSPKQLGDVLFNRLKLPVFKKTKTGPSTDEEVLRSLSARHALPQKLLEYRQLMKLKNTYIDTLPELADARTDRVHTVFNQTGTETGRLSSSKPNLQNIPIKTDLGRRIRESVISFSKRNFLLSCDYSQIELRIMAHMSQDIILLDAFKLDKDIHKATAALIHDCDEQEVDEKMRDVAKRINFGIIYGLSAFGLSRDLGVPHEQAQMFIDAYFSRYAGVKDYIERQIAQAEEDGFVSTLFGRRRYLPEIRNKNQAMRQLAQRQAINTPLQGTASDIIKKAMIDIYFQITKHKLSGKMILQIHDELLFDIPNKDLADFSGMVKEKMENVCKLSVPIRVVMKAGNNWSEMSEL